jgi:hypothetical protein
MKNPTTPSLSSADLHTVTGGCATCGNPAHSAASGSSVAQQAGQWAGQWAGKLASQWAGRR